MIEEKILSKAGDIIKNGGLVAIPTETVYGLGADMFNPKAVAKIFEAKSRPFFDPLITHIADIEMLYNLAIIDKDIIKKATDAFWPGPLTIIVKKRDIVPDIVSSGLDTMAVRMPKHKVALEIIKRSTGAVVAPSANPFGYLSPTTADHVREQLGDRIDMVVDGGLCEVGVESTVLDLTRERPIVLRPGGISIEELRDVLGEVEVFNRKVTSPTAPGQLESHYAPRTPLRIIESLNEVENSEKSAYLSFGEEESKLKFKCMENLSELGDLIEAASRLFYSLHKLDREDVEKIYVKKIPLEGIGIAIMDRLYKASEK